VAERRRLPIAPVMGRGIMTKTVAPAYSAGDGQSATCAHPHYRLQDLQDPPTEEKGSATSGLSLLLYSSLFLFLSLFLSLVYPWSFPWSIKGKDGHPTWGSFFGQRLRSISQHSEALQLHFTFTRDFGAHPSLDRL
jgi:hypothetical protein